MVPSMKKKTEKGTYDGLEHQCFGGERFGQLR